jgi:hypothetical protein
MARQLQQLWIMAEKTLHDRLVSTLGGPVQSARAAGSLQTSIRARREQLAHEIGIAVAGRIDQIHVCRPVGNARWRIAEQLILPSG